jgi:hypothetical protein
MHEEVPTAIVAAWTLHSGISRDGEKGEHWRSRLAAGNAVIPSRLGLARQGWGFKICPLRCQVETQQRHSKFVVTSELAIFAFWVLLF